MLKRRRRNRTLKAQFGARIQAYRQEVRQGDFLAELVGKLSILDARVRLIETDILRAGRVLMLARFKRDLETAARPRSVSMDPRDGYALGDPKRLAFESKAWA